MNRSAASPVAEQTADDVYRWLEVPEGYHRLPAGPGCDCDRAFRPAPGESWCCLGARRPAPAPISKAMPSTLQPSVSHDDLERWTILKANLRSPNSKIRRSAWNEMERMELRWIEDAETKWRREAIEETLNLARGRGEAVDELPGGSITISTRSGLKSALTKRYLNSNRHTEGELYQVGLLYRDCMEVVEAQATPDKGDGRGARGPAGPQHALLYAAEVMRRLRKGLTLKQELTLDLVCGMDIALDGVRVALCTRHETACKYLRDGLERAADNWVDRPRSKVLSKTAIAKITGAIELAAKGL